MVRDVSLSWFCHGSSWFVMFHCHGFVMVRHGSFMVHCHGFVMVRHGLSTQKKKKKIPWRISLSWFVWSQFKIMVSSWFVMCSTLNGPANGSSCFTVMVDHDVMVCHGSSWFVMVHCLWFGKQMAHHGSSWFTVMVPIMVHQENFDLLRRTHSKSWFTVMVRHGSLWFTVMVSSWFVMVCDVLFSKILQKKVM